MKKANLLVMLFISTLMFLSCGNDESKTNNSTKSIFELPKGWRIRGDAPEKYEMGIDKGAGQSGKNAATIKSIDESISGFGTLLQNCLPDSFLGKRVKMSGYVKTKEVANWAGLWLRIDTKTVAYRVGFDNMHDGKTDRSIKGTTDWKKYEIVLDVPHNACNLAYGALIDGTGQIWFDNLKFEAVDITIPTTGVPMGLDSAQNVSHLKEPYNLDFEE